ncbi:serine hydrolase [Ciceribacter sp. L1K22]|uniref:serine hydrolase domain-containing protein n=1 Tax=Ciceribacter sp. L1K22 TaxID=2820275 RepID=UPI001ABE10CA|nr:serine hydrolase [Ciceribacter sp. L1K22]MBO3762130.1 serine hydrolase [Ciceribacter sp. L1K22]
MTTEFEKRYGFARADVTLANWRTTPYSRWSFHNVEEIVPTARIACSVETPETEVVSDLLDQPMDTGLDTAATPRAFLEYAHTDGFVLMKSGNIVSEYYAPHSGAEKNHIIFSISKSMTALIFGILEADGVLDADKPVVHYLPEAAGSAYGDCTCRDVLDMRVSLDFEESYLNVDGHYGRYRRAMLWNPPLPGQPVDTMVGLLTSLKKGDGPHGGPFHYQSPNSDLLGIIIERSSGRRIADLVSERLWKPMGALGHASITVDAIGTARTAGGMSMRARDLARVGEMLRMNGVADGNQVIPTAWVADMRTAGSHQAWVDGDETFLPEGRYRSQWYQSGLEDGAFCAIGIHGQWLYVDPSTETVVVKLSSQPNPLDDELKQDNFAFFRALCRV